MLKNTILIVGSAYVGIVMPEVFTGVALLIASAVGVFALAFERMNKAYGS